MYAHGSFGGNNRPALGPLWGGALLTTTVLAFTHSTDISAFIAMESRFAATGKAGSVFPVGYGLFVRAVLGV